MRNVASIALLTLFSVSCAAPKGTEFVEVDEAIRAPLFDAVAALEGDWVLSDGMGGEADWRFEVSSAGTAVRETMMRGSEHEMTNLYTLDGNGLAMVHYCASGNQPRMLATGLDGDEMAFEFQQVYDLKAKDEGFMGAMTLVFIDENTIEQHWKGMRPDGESANHDTVMHLSRR